MPVSTPHPCYTLNLESWQKVSDALQGQQAIANRRTHYLPKLADQTDTEHLSYFRRATWFGATGRTLDAWTGTIMRKPAVVVAPDELDRFLENADLRGTPFSAYINETVKELCSQGRCGTLIDWNEQDNQPYLSHYTALDIINWHIAVQGGKIQLTKLILSETYLHQDDDGFTQTQQTQYRVYEIREGVVNVTVHKPILGKDAYAATETMIPMRKGKALTEIPFVFHGVGSDAYTIPVPPLLDLAEINFAHFRNTADYENGLHIAGLPTPWAAGFTDDKTTTLTLGTAKAWVTDEVNAKCGFLEFSGSGLNPLKEAIAAKETQMARLGAMLLEHPGGDAEAFETVHLRNTAETNSLTQISDAASRSLSLVVAWAAWWTGNNDAPQELITSEAAYVQVNKDLAASTATPAQIQAWLSAYQSGAISYETFFFNMRRGEFYEEGRTIEEEKTAIEQAPVPKPREDPNEPDKKQDDGAA